MNPVENLKVSRHVRFRQHKHMTACWVWTGTVNIHTGQNVTCGTTARRAVWLKMRGPLSDDEILRSTCGHSDCVNPNHARKVRKKRRMSA